MRRLVLDASVLLAAPVGRPEGSPSLLVEAARSGAIEMIACETLFGEFQRGLRERQFLRAVDVGTVETNGAPGGSPPKRESLTWGIRHVGHRHGERSATTDQTARWLTDARFGPYLAEAEGNHDLAVELYVWNACISSALFETLHHVEVLLRTRSTRSSFPSTLELPRATPGSRTPPSYA